MQVADDGTMKELSAVRETDLHTAVSNRISAILQCYESKCQLCLDVDMGLRQVSRQSGSLSYDPLSPLSSLYPRSFM